MTNSKFRSVLSCAPQTGWQLLAFAICLLFGMAMVVNIQLGGEATWFWYAQLMHQGVRLYSDLHLPLQPWYVVETNAWIRVVGIRCLLFESLSVLHVLLLCFGMLLVLRESRWPDFWKAIILLAAFFADIFFVAIRFDDFHVVNDICYLFAIILLVRIYRAGRPEGELGWACALGLLCGLAFANRSTDGGTLLWSAFVCVAVLARSRRISAVLCYTMCAVLAIACVVALTGDSFHAYLDNSIFHAAAAKGGRTTLMHGPSYAIVDNLYLFRHQKRCWWFLLVLALGAATHRVWKRKGAVIITGLLIVCVVTGVIAMTSARYTLWNGTFLSAFNIAVQFFIYPLAIVVLYRALRAWLTTKVNKWDPREVLVLIPVAGLISAAVSQANGTTNSTLSLMLLILMATWWLPTERDVSWISECLVVAASVVVASGATYKIATPYNWNTYSYDKMFTHREWYSHPIYGPLYLESEQLNLIRPICSEIGGIGRSQELLSLPYSYANYFCGTPPWHGYVQTWFDTTAPDTIKTLMHELDQAPPQWILYERQIKVLEAHEREYNGGKPIAHRALDQLIMRHISDGTWSLVDTRKYSTGDGWFLIRTHT